MLLSKFLVTKGTAGTEVTLQLHVSTEELTMLQKLQHGGGEGIAEALKTALTQVAATRAFRRALTDFGEAG